jgi:phage-related protein
LSSLVHLSMTEKLVQFVFYLSSSGNEPVKEWLMSLDIEDRKTVRKDLLKIEEGQPIGMAVCRSLGDGLLECRSNIKNGIARVVFCVSGMQWDYEY